MIGSRQDLASVLLVVAFDFNALREFVWLTSDLIELPKGYGKGHEVVFHYANQHAHLFDILQVVFCLLMFLFLTACVTRVCCCWSAAGWIQDFVNRKKLGTKKSPS